MTWQLKQSHYQLNCGQHHESGMHTNLELQTHYRLGRLNSCSCLAGKKLKKSSISDDSMISSVAICNIICRLQLERNRDSTRKNYHAIWKLFSKFYFKLDIKPDNWEDRILLFVGYLIENNRQPSTIKSYISALKSVLKDDKIDICEDRFLLNSFIKACKYRNKNVRIRKSIQKHLLKSILCQVDKKFLNDEQPYLATLYVTIISSAYYGLLRVGEVAQGAHPILARDMQLASNKQKALFILRSSKTHCESDMPQSVKITSSFQKCFSNESGKVKVNSVNIHCPYSLLRKYIQIRPKYLWDSEPFFVYRDRSPVRTITISKVLRFALNGCRMNACQYSFHSLRSGWAVDLLKHGVSVETIKKIGCWKSNAVFSYLNNFN